MEVLSRPKRMKTDKKVKYLDITIDYALKPFTHVKLQLY